MKIPTLFPNLRVSAAKSPIPLVRQVSRLSVGASTAVFFAIFAATANTPSASAQAVAFAGTGAVNFGTANVCPSGKTTPAPCSQTLTLTYNVTASGTLGTPTALTTGAPNLDYKLASGSTCAGSVAKGSTCKVNVTFAPIAPGARNGAVEVVDASGNVLATTYIYGTGTGPAIGFDQPAQLTLGSGFKNPEAVAVDAGGNVFVADSLNSEVKEILAVNGAIPPNPVIVVLAGTYENGPGSLALDGAGNVFVADNVNLTEIAAAGGYATAKHVGSAVVAHPEAVAVDGSGNLFVAQNDPGNVGSVQELLAASGYATAKRIGASFDFELPVGIALDASGNVFVVDLYAPPTEFGNDGSVVEIFAAGDYASVKFWVMDFYYTYPDAISVDPAGNVYVCFEYSPSVTELLAVDGTLPSNPQYLVFESDFYYPTGIAFDGHGNIFIADEGNSLVRELRRSQPSALSFAPTPIGETSIDSPYSVQIQNVGNALLAGASLSVSPNWDQVAGSGTPEDCAASFSLVPGAQCNLSISFEPLETGPLVGAVSFEDNSLNATNAMGSIPLSGTGLAPPPPPGIASLNTTYAAPYSVVILNGTNFGAARGSSKVTFSDIATPHYSWSNTQIYVTVPPNATTGNLVVTVNGQASNAIPFTVLPMPAVTGISPTSGPVGTIVTISGTNLLDYENKAIVTFDAKSAPILSDTGTAIKVAIPATALTSHFHVLVNDTGINTPTFTVTP